MTDFPSVTHNCVIFNHHQLQTLGHLNPYLKPCLRSLISMSLSLFAYWRNQITWPLIALNQFYFLPCSFIGLLIRSKLCHRFYNHIFITLYYWQCWQDTDRYLIKTIVCIKFDCFWKVGGYMLEIAISELKSEHGFSQGNSNDSCLSC